MADDASMAAARTALSYATTPPRKEPNMAARKDVPAERETPKHHTMAMSSDDIARPRMRVVTSSSDYQKMRPKMFNEGDIVVGFSADDVDATLLWDAEAGDAEAGVIVHVLSHSKHLTADKDDNGDKQPFTRYEIGDPAAPRKAKMVHEYVLLIPSYDTMLPVMAAFSPGSSAAARGINTAILRHQQSGDPRELAFRLTTARKTANGYTWDAYAALAVEPEPQNQLLAQNMGDALTPAAPRQLAAAVAQDDDSAY